MSRGRSASSGVRRVQPSGRVAAVTDDRSRGGRVEIGVRIGDPMGHQIGDEIGPRTGDHDRTIVRTSPPSRTVSPGCSCRPRRVSTSSLTVTSPASIASRAWAPSSTTPGELEHLTQADHVVPDLHVHGRILAGRPRVDVLLG